MRREDHPAAGSEGESADESSPGHDSGQHDHLDDTLVGVAVWPFREEAFRVCERLPDVAVLSPAHQDGGTALFLVDTCDHRRAVATVTRRVSDALQAAEIDGHVVAAMSISMRVALAVLSERHPEMAFDAVEVEELAMLYLGLCQPEFEVA